MLLLATTGGSMSRYVPKCIWQGIVCVMLMVPSCEAAESVMPPAVAPPESGKRVKPPFRVARGTSHFLQKYSGLNWVTERTASGLLSAALSVKTGGVVRAKVRTYSFTDLLDGEFRSVDLKFAGSKVKGVPLGHLNVSTEQPFKVRYFNYMSHKAGLKTPLLLSVEGQSKETDVGRALKSPAVTESLRFLKLDLPGLGKQHLQVLEPTVELRDNKVHVNSWLVTAGAGKETGIKLDVVARPVLEDERRIVLEDLQVTSSDIENPQAFSGFASELLNPLVDVGRMDRHTHAFRLERLQVADKKVGFAGRLLLAPKPKNPYLPIPAMPKAAAKAAI